MKQKPAKKSASKEKQPTVTERKPWWRRLGSDPLLGWSVGLVALWRIGLEILNQAGPHPSFAANFVRWANWDGTWYLDIIHNGYHNPDLLANVAFFPGFPQIVALIAKLTGGNPLYIGLELNILLTAAGVYLLMKLARLLAVRHGAEKYQRHIAVLSAISFLGYVSSFFLIAFYADALLVLGFMGAVYCALTNRYWLASGFAVLASLSKITGVIAALIVAIIALEEWLKERRRRPKQLIGRWLTSSLGIAGFITYITYLWQKFGDPLLFYKVESVWGRSHDGFFLPKLVHGYYEHFFDTARFGNLYTHANMMVAMLLPFIILSVGLLCVRVYRTAWPLVLGIATILIPLSTGLMESLNRYCLVLAPIIPFLIIWLIQRARPWLLYILFGVCSFGVILGAYGFLDGKYFGG